MTQMRSQTCARVTSSERPRPSRESGITMGTALDADHGRLDKGEQNFVENVRRHGWCGTHVAADEDGPGFSYTTGFWLKFNFPELILFSLRGPVAHDTFWHVCRELEAGKHFAIGEPADEIFENSAAVLLPVSPQQYQAYLGWSRWFYESDAFQCLQLVFPDSSGDFPWSRKTSDAFRAAQPDLTAGNWSGRRHFPDRSST
jgi:uncharacterized protein DUF4262